MISFDTKFFHRWRAVTRKTAWSRPPLGMWTLLGMPIEWVKYTTQEYEI